MCTSAGVRRLFVVGVLTGITAIAYSSQIMVFWSFLGGATLRTYLVLGPLNVFVILIYVNYYLATTTDPGAVPLHYEPPTKNRQTEVKRSTHQPRYCKTCNGFKPPRSHHCRQCGRCVLKMDHHCPWINNCVGHRNYGHFLRFIMTVDIATIYVLVLLCWRVAVILDDMRNFKIHAEPKTMELVFLVVNFVLDVPVLFSVGILSGYHIYCVSTNTTTIEGWEKGKVATMVRRGKIQDVKFPYDVGIYNNIKQVLGDNPLFWLWPKSAKGDGLHFAVAKDTDELEAYFWPPRDPDDLLPSIFSSRYTKQAMKRRTTRNPNLTHNSSQAYHHSNHNNFAFPNQISPSSDYNHNSDGTTHHIEYNNHTDSSDTHIDDLTRLPPHNPYIPPRPRRHVRRDSEGFIVRELTAEDRQRMLSTVDMHGAYDPRAEQRQPLLNFEEEERGRRGVPTSIVARDAREGGHDDVQYEGENIDDYYDSGSAISDSGPEFSESEEEEEEEEGYYREGYEDERGYYNDEESRVYGAEEGIPLREMERRRWEEQERGEYAPDEDDDDEQTPLAMIVKKQREAMGWPAVGGAERKGKGKED